jgi:phage replication O-like protein O
MKLEQPLASYGNPQKEDGYTPIANELLEAILKADFSKRQLLIIMTVARMTYGYSKKSDALSGWQIASMTNLDRSDVSKTINELVNLNVLIKHENGRESHGIFVNEIAINKLYKSWVTVGNSPTVVKLPTVGKTPTVTVGNLPTQPLVKHPTHKAIKTNKTSIAKTSTLKTSIPSDFTISERVKKWANAKGYFNLEAHLEHFILACEGKNYKYANWDSAFMTAIKDNWAKVQNKKPNGVVL